MIPVADKAYTGRRAWKHLSRGRILVAALEFLRTHPLRLLTMRSLAAKLEIDPSSLYHYFSTKAALMDAIGDQLASEIVEPDPNHPDWRLQTEALNRSVFELAQKRPQAYPLLLELGGRLPALRRIRTLQMATFERAGLTQETAALAAGIVGMYVRGSGLAEAQIQPSPLAGHPTKSERLRQFDIGLDVVLRGLESRFQFGGTPRTGD